MPMMRVRKLDSDGDMRFGGQQADFWRDAPDGVAQTVQTRLGLWTGEWFLDVEEGTPYIGAVLGAGTRETAGPAIRSRILGTPGVLSLDSFGVSRDADARTTTVAAEITTAYGTTTLEGAL